MLKVWGRRSSFNLQKVMWLIGELELPHEHIDAGGQFGGLDTPDFLAMNPHGRIPVIRTTRHGMGIACDPSLSCRAAIVPDDSGRTIPLPRRRRRLDGLVADRAAARFSGRRVLGLLSHARDKRNWPAINAALARCAKDFGKLDRLLEGRSFLLGETLSLADITAGTSLYRYFELEIERPQLAGVERWYRALREREAFRTHIMIPFGELRGRLLDA
jgi:glutathione S-transferase